MICSGLVGRSILSSRSPWLHEQEARAQGLALTYALFDFNERGLADDALPAFLHDLAGQGFAGVNITYPFKQQVIPALDELSQSAAFVGAVNTVAMRDGRLIGHNTDMEGFRDSLQHGLPTVRKDHVLLLGAGGAGSAVASALLSLDVGLLSICDADGPRAQALVASLATLFGPQRVAFMAREALATGTVDGLVNATPMGMAAHPGLPLASELILPTHWVADIVYFPIETAFLKAARTKGCQTLDGSGMVIAQAARAFEIITNRKADQARMRRSFVAG
ncbi:MAG TPA: shikimate dehydrogenase [Sphingobium sp.]|nr:shikimate dehydrogenase [Sphingobium sp.]